MITDWNSQRPVFGCAPPLIAALVMASPANVFAGPRVIEEAAQIALPDAQSRLVSVAIDGDALIVTGRRELEGAFQIDHSAWLYQRQTNGQWTLVPRLLQQGVPDNGIFTALLADMHGRVAALVNGESSWIYKKVGTTWVPAVSPIQTNGFDGIVSASVRRIGAAGTNNWFGLATRYRDAGNYYYVTVRNNNTVALRKLVNGAIVELTSAPFTVTSGTWYRLRFEAIGTHLRVYINRVRRLEASDASHPTGRYGPVMYRTAAEYDDMIAVQP